jgi:RNA polymerase sigma-70 factor (ECF subfamily)
MADLEAARKGDRDAQERLVVRLQHGLERQAENRLGEWLRGRTRASDVVQNTWLEILRCLDRFEGSTEESFLAWAKAILENAIRRQDRYLHAERRKNPERTSEANRVAEFLTRGVPTPSAQAANTEDIDRLTRAFATLAPDYRSVIQLTVVEGRPHDEVAEIMGRSPSATRMLLHRARAALLIEVDRQGG